MYYSIISPSKRPRLNLNQKNLSSQRISQDEMQKEQKKRGEGGIQEIFKGGSD